MKTRTVGPRGVNEVGVHATPMARLIVGLLVRAVGVSAGVAALIGSALMLF